MSLQELMSKVMALPSVTTNFRVKVKVIKNNLHKYFVS
jgi:hypothetical protein